MSTNNRDIEINPLSQLYDELRLILSGLVVKFASEADKYETFENRKYSDQYLSALNKTDNFGLYDFTSDEYRQAGIDNDEVILTWVFFLFTYIQYLTEIQTIGCLTDFFP